MPFPQDNIKTTERAVELGRKGGQSTSLKKKYAAQLRGLRKRGDTNAEVAFFVKRLEDPAANILHIQQLLDRFLKDHPKEHNAVTAMNTLIQLHKANFGEKRQNVNINVNVTMEEWERRLIEE